MNLRKERLEIEFNKQLQMKIHELEMSLETEISERFEKMEQEEINRLEDGHSQRLSEREQQLRRG